MAGTSSRRQVVPLDKCQRSNNLSLQTAISNRFKSKFKLPQLLMTSKSQIMVKQLPQKVANLVEHQELVDSKRKSTNNQQLPKTEKQTVVQDIRNKHLTTTLNNRNPVNLITITPRKQVMLSCPTTTSLSCTEVVLREIRMLRPPVNSNNSKTTHLVAI